MASSISAEFARLAERFDNIDATGPEDGERYLRNVSAFAFATLRRASQAGALTLVDEAGVVTVLDIAEPTAAAADIEGQEQQCALGWYGFCIDLGRRHRIGNVSLFRKAGDGHLAKGRDWRERGHNYGAICRLLADLCGGPETAFLDVVLGDREASRLLDGATLGPVTFGNKARPWELLTMLVDAGQDGVANGAVQDKFRSKQYVYKATLLKLITPLRLNIHTDGGTWKLVHLP